MVLLGNRELFTRCENDFFQLRASMPAIRNYLIELPYRDFRQYGSFTEIAGFLSISGTLFYVARHT